MLLERGFGYFFFCWGLWGAMMYGVVTYVENHLTSLNMIEIKISDNLSWKDAITNRSYCRYPEWVELAIKTGDISKCK